MVEQPSEAMPEDVRQAFWGAVRLFGHWKSDSAAADTSPPALKFRGLIVSLSGVCDLVLAYKNEPLPMNVHDELWRRIDTVQTKLKEELAIDPSYATGARCLDTLAQDRKSAVALSRALAAET